MKQEKERHIKEIIKREKKGMKSRRRKVNKEKIADEKESKIDLERKNNGKANTHIKAEQKSWIKKNCVKKRQKSKTMYD